MLVLDLVNMSKSSVDDSSTQTSPYQLDQDGIKNLEVLLCDKICSHIDEKISTLQMEFKTSITSNTDDLTSLAEKLLNLENKLESLHFVAKVSFHPFFPLLLLVLL